MAINTTIRLKLDKDQVDRGMRGVEQQAGRMSGKLAGMAIAATAVGVAAGKALRAAASGAIDLGKEIVEQSEKLGSLKEKLGGLKDALVESIAGGFDRAANVEQIGAMLDAWSERLKTWGQGIGVALADALMGETKLLAQVFSVLGQVAFDVFSVPFRDFFKRMQGGIPERPGRLKNRKTGEIFDPPGEQADIIPADTMERIRALEKALLERINKLPPGLQGEIFGPAPVEAENIWRSIKTWPGGVQGLPQVPWGPAQTRGPWDGEGSTMEGILREINGGIQKLNQREGIIVGP